VSVSFKVEGLRDVERALDDLSKATGRAALRRALKKSAQPLVEGVKRRAPVDDGSLRDSVAIAARLAPSVAKVARRLGDPKSSVQLYLGPKWPEGAHGHLVEFGTAPRVKKSTGQAVGAMPAQPFMRPAWEAGQAAVLKRLETNLWSEVTKSLERARRKAAQSRQR